jgi:hypothetical protein
VMRPTEFSRLGRWLGVVVLVPLVFGSTGCSDDRRAFRNLLDSVQEQSQPPAGRVLATSSPAWRGGAVFATWDLETRQEWPRYATWLTRRLGSNWTLLRNGKDQYGRIEFIRTIGQDRLVLKARASAIPARAELTFEVIPN